MRCPIAARSLLLVELERRTVHAIALPGGLRPIREDVAEVAAAFGAMHLGAGHEEAAIARGADRLAQGLPERRPAGATFILGRGIEQRRAAARADEGARPLFVVERAGTGAFGAVLAQHLVLQRIELLFPLGVALLDGKGLGIGLRAHDG